MWHFPVLHYCVGRDSRAFADHWVSGSLEGAMINLHVLAVLLCSVYRAVACSLHFLGSPPQSPFFIVFFIIYPVGSPLFFPFSVTGGGAGFRAGFLRQAGLMTGLQVGQALRCSSYLG